jgi:hypothetical protein
MEKTNLMLLVIMLLGNRNLRNKALQNTPTNSPKTKTSK